MRSVLGALALVFALALGGRAQGPPTHPTMQPLVQAVNLQCVGGFRLWQGWGPGEFDTFQYGGYAAAWDATRGGLFLSGHVYGSYVAEVTIPSQLGSCTEIATMPVAPLLQGFQDPTEGQQGKILTALDGSSIVSSIRSSGLVVSGAKLIAPFYAFYDAANQQVWSHFVRPSDLRVTGQVTGPHRFTAAAGYISGAMTAIPPEWQALLGGDTLGEQWGVPIVTRSSYGPAAFAFTASHLGTVDPVPATPLLYYNAQHPTLGGWDASGTLWNSANSNGGMVFLRGTRTILYALNHGVGPFCYSVDGCPPYGERTTSWPYQPSLYAYDANEFLAVKNGTKQPWEPVPYATIALGPQNSSAPQATAYDPAGQRIFLVMSGDGNQPYVLVYALNVGGQGRGRSN